jgi:FMN phosphatase YigB (HAD superfamily)
MGVVKRIRTVLFDIGGVLATDPWQSLLLAPAAGIADRLGISRDAAEKAGERLWPTYSLSVRTEAEYWADLARELNVVLPGEVISQAERETLRVNAAATEAVRMLECDGVRWGYVTDNTAFWLAKQIHLLGDREPETDDLRFYSFERELSKTSTPRGLFELASEVHDPAATLVVDDRPENLHRAGAAGFLTSGYSMTGTDLLATLRRHLELG